MEMRLSKGRGSDGRMQGELARRDIFGAGNGSVREAALLETVESSGPNSATRVASFHGPHCDRSTYGPTLDVPLTGNPKRTKGTSETLADFQGITDEGVSVGA